MSKELKEQIKRDRELNRTFISTSPDTQNSLGILAIEKDAGVIRKNNLYLKTYKTRGLDGTDKTNLISTIMDCGGRVRFTTILDSKKGIMDYLTVYHVGDTYAPARDHFEKVEEALKGDGLDLKTLGIEELLNTCASNFGITGSNLGLAESLKKKRDWKKDYFPAIKNNDTGYTYDGRCGNAYIATEYPQTSCINPFAKLLELGCTVGMALDLCPYDATTAAAFERLMEKQYNKKASYVADDMVNTSYTLLFMAESADLCKIIDRSVIHAAGEGLVLTSCAGFAAEPAVSLYSLGLTDYKIMRNTSRAIAADLLA